MPEVQYPVPVLEDQLLIKRLEKQPQDNCILELGISYLNSSINERGYDKPLIPRLCVLADTRSGLLLSQDMITPEEDEVDTIFEIGDDIKSNFKGVYNISLIKKIL